MDKTLLHRLASSDVTMHEIQQISMAINIVEYMIDHPTFTHAELILKYGDWIKELFTDPKPDVG